MPLAIPGSSSTTKMRRAWTAREPSKPLPWPRAVRSSTSGYTRPMNWVAFNSTALAGAGYDPETHRLTVRFNDGRDECTHRQVPPPIWQGLLRASAKGQYYAAKIRDRYPI